MEHRISTDEFSLDAGNAALDFANTLDSRHDPQPVENLPDYRALLAFTVASGLLDTQTRDHLEAKAVNRLHEAGAIHAAALALREAIFEVAAALATGDEPVRSDLQIIRRLAARATAAGELIYEGEGFRWVWNNANDELEHPIWPIAHAAVQLFTRQDLSRLRICAADDCEWLFLDETRNRSRKWCDMNTCGNRAKVARYRLKRE